MTSGKMNGDVGMSWHEKERKQEDAYTKTQTHSSLRLCSFPTFLFVVNALGREKNIFTSNFLCEIDRGLGP